MSKTIYLIILLSILLLKSETSFGLASRLPSNLELGVCGKTMAAILTTNPKKEPLLKKFMIKENEYCDLGRYEENANYIIYIYNMKDELIYDKYVYLNENTFLEQTNSKGEFIKIKVLPSNNSRIIKIPITREMGEAFSYKIESLVENKIYGIKKIKW